MEKEKIMKFAPKFGPHILVSNVGAVETERRKNPHDIKQHHFFCFWKVWTVEFPMGMVYSTYIYLEL